MARVETSLGLIDVFQPRIGNFLLTKIKITQPGISISFARDPSLRGFLVNPKDQAVWILLGPPDNEPDLQTIS